MGFSQDVLAFWVVRWEKGIYVGKGDKPGEHVVLIDGVARIIENDLVKFAN
jgi:hypothetical protein